jgi:hypothetical protein
VKLVLGHDQLAEPRTQRSGVSGRVRSRPLTPLRCVRGSANQLWLTTSPRAAMTEAYQGDRHVISIESSVKM